MLHVASPHVQHVYDEISLRLQFCSQLPGNHSCRVLQDIDRSEEESIVQSAQSDPVGRQGWQIPMACTTIPTDPLTCIGFCACPNVPASVSLMSRGCLLGATNQQSFSIPTVRLTQVLQMLPCALHCFRLFDVHRSFSSESVVISDRSRVRMHMVDQRGTTPYRTADSHRRCEAYAVSRRELRRQPHHNLMPDSE